jgi:hypothetical protein
MNLKNQSCGNCFYFLKTSQNENQEIGCCRCNPPMPLHEYDRDTDSMIPRVARFPVVLSSMWCGSWDNDQK